MFKQHRPQLRSLISGALGTGLVLVVSACATSDEEKAPPSTTPKAGDAAEPTIPAHLPEGPVVRALASIARNPERFAASTNDRFRARDVIVDASGAEHVRFERAHRGLPVVGGDVVAHGRRDGALEDVSRTLEGAIALDTNQFAFPRERVAGVAEQALASRGILVANSETPESVVFARSEKGPRLAYNVVVSGSHPDGTPAEVHVVVDGIDGTVLEAADHVATAEGTGRSLLAGTVAIGTNPIRGGFELRDLARGGQTTLDLAGARRGGSVFTDADNTWGNFLSSDPATAAVDAHYGAEKTWDYYLTVHGRNGIRNDGQGASSRVHYGRNYSNAFWSDACFCMTYGDGDGRTLNPLVALDVAGHEMSHGITASTARLVYSGESGGLNEATSDIFGTMVEFYANNEVSTPNYDIGETLFKSGTSALRYMHKPSLDRRSPDCWSRSLGSLDVHYSSGVANHFFYLLAEGTNPARGPASPTCAASDGQVATGSETLEGIGRSAAERIWYRALTVYFVSSTNYAGARRGTLRAAADLFGEGSAEQSAVDAAWTAVNLR